MNNIFLYWENAKNKITPDYIELCRQSIYKHNKNIAEIILIDNKNLSEYIDIPNNLFKIPKIANRTDYIRVALLHKYGGIWLDSDCICLKPLVDIFNLMKKYDFVGVYNAKKNISNGFMSANKESPIMTHMHEYILNKLKIKHRFHWLEIASEAVTFSYQEFKDFCYILEQDYISPIDWNQWKLFFSNSNIDYIPKHSYTVMLFNEVFNRNNCSITTQNKDELLNQSTLLSKLFRMNI